MGNFRPRKAPFRVSFSQDSPPQMTQRTSWLCLYVVGQETPEVSYPTDLSNGYQTGPEYRKNSKCTWNRQQMAQYGSSARYICLSLCSRLSHPVCEERRGLATKYEQRTSRNRDSFSSKACQVFPGTLRKSSCQNTAASVSQPPTAKNSNAS